MASGSRTPWRLSAALWAERRVPALARRLRPSPILRGEPRPIGTVFRGGESGPLLVLAGDAGAAPDWLGSALATALGGIAVVLTDEPSAADATAEDPGQRQGRLADRLTAAVEAGAALGTDPDRVAVVGVGHAVAAALAATRSQPLIRRLVLLTPAAAPEPRFDGLPPTFLQSSPHSPTRSVGRSLEIDLREAGVAVRPVEYVGLHDAWVRYSQFAPGSKRAVQDIVAFLRRGFGMEGTFSGVIPGWDLT
jgi:hypothetical protein